MDRDYEQIFVRVKVLLDRIAQTIVPNGGALTELTKIALYILVFLALPLLVLVSLPYGIGIILLILIAAFLLFCGIPFNF